MKKKKTEPDFFLNRVYDITPKFLAENHIRGLILDVDNTLALAEHPDPYEGVETWLYLMKQNGIRMVILSNNWASRVQLLADKVKLPYISAAMKPSPIGFMRSIKKLKLNKSEIVMVGDQLFTDILGGNLYGVRTILVEPFSSKGEDQAHMRLKRKIEVQMKEKAKAKLQDKEKSE